MKPIKVDRVATVKATGRRFVVRNLSIPRDKSEPIRVYCYGNVVSGREAGNGGARWRYDDTVVFLRDAVEIEEKKLSFEFIAELFLEGQIWKGAERGELVQVKHGRTGNTTVRRYKASPDQLLRAAVAAEEKGIQALSDLYLDAAYLEAAEN